MEVDFDPAKRQRTLAERGLDMAEAGLVLSGATLTVADDRADYGEPPFITIRRLRGRLVVIAWTPRGAAHRIISMRKANDREQAIYGARL